MRRSLAFIMFAICFVSTISQAQKDVTVLNGYKYVGFAPITYQDGSIDQYNLTATARNIIAAAGFGILSSNLNKANLPKDVIDDPCMVLTCTIEHPSPNPLSNSVTVSFWNCKNQLVYKSKASSSMGMNFEGDFRHALKKALKEISGMAYTYNPSLTPEMTLAQVESVNETESSLKAYLDSNKMDPLEGIYKSYQSEDMGYYKFGIKKRDGKYIAIVFESDTKAWKPGEIKAFFERSSIANVYSVQWYMKNKSSVETFGTVEFDGLLSIEFKDPSGLKKQNRFIKMYPHTVVAATTKKSTASGSGFFISTGGMVATNAHVVEGSKEISVSLNNEKGNFNYRAKLILIDKNNDVAILQIDDNNFKTLSVIPYRIIETADVGEKTFTIGYPLHDIMGTNYKVTDGIVSAVSGIGDDLRYYQISVPLQPGNSGGPLFNGQGNIIGITSARLNSEAVRTNVENVNYAIKSTYLLALMKMLPGIEPEEKTNVLSNKELKDQVKVLKDYVCIITAN